MESTEKAIKDLLPDIKDFYVQDIIRELADYYEKFKEAESTIWWLSLRETMRVEDWNNIRDQIKQDIIKNGMHYEYEDDKGNSDYIIGALSAMRLIEHRVHCICDL